MSNSPHGTYYLSLIIRLPDPPSLILSLMLVFHWHGNPPPHIKLNIFHHPCSNLRKYHQTPPLHTKLTLSSHPCYLIWKLTSFTLSLMLLHFELLTQWPTIPWRHFLVSNLIKPTILHLIPWLGKPATHLTSVFEGCHPPIITLPLPLWTTCPMTSWHYCTTPPHRL